MANAGVPTGAVSLLILQKNILFGVFNFLVLELNLQDRLSWTARGKDGERKRKTFVGCFDCAEQWTSMRQ
jgi:hypothetical protein